MGYKKFVFSEEQEQFLIDHWQEFSIHKFKTIFGCSWSAVFKKAQEMGLDMKKEERWTENDEALLREYAKKYHYATIAKKMNKTDAAIYLKARRLGIVLIQDRRKWTEDEERELHDKWGSKRIEQIAAEMKRTVFSIRVKATRMKLGPMSEGDLDKITVSELSKTIGISRDHIMRLKERNVLKLKRKMITNKKSLYYVKIDDLWIFLENHQELWNSNKLSKYGLGIEPEWLAEKRQKDLENPPMLYQRWSCEEREIAKTMLLEGYDYEQIGKKINRTKEAVRYELNRMRMSYRLKQFWRGKELKLLQELFPEKTAKELSVILDRTPKAILAKTSELGIKKRMLVKK